MEEIRIYEHRGLHLEYQITGDGTPVIFLHGMGGGLGQIRSVYDKTEGIRLIIPVMQGHGGSEADWEHYDFDHLGDDVTALMDELGLQEAMLAGISMGAGTALNIAVRHPERVTSLLLIRNAWTDRPMEPDVIQAYEDLGRCLRERRTGSLSENARLGDRQRTFCVYPQRVHQTLCRSRRTEKLAEIPDPAPEDTDPGQGSAETPADAGPHPGKPARPVPSLPVRGMDAAADPGSGPDRDPG